MPSISCNCGNLIGLGSFPNSDVYSLVSEERFDKVEDPVDSEKLQKLFFSGARLCHCKACGRIIVTWSRKDEWHSFVAEPAVPESVRLEGPPLKEGEIECCQCRAIVPANKTACQQCGWTWNEDKL